jgi:hypothetical protein
MSMQSRRAAITFALAAAAAMARAAAAGWPPAQSDDMENPASWPSDPGYDGQWNLWSFIPAENKARVSDYELAIGAGIHADRAWQRTIGDRRVVIAVLDSGIRWRERDLVNKYYLSRGELPVPESACGDASGDDAHDVNDDGAFNVQDYTTATGTTQPTPETLCDSRVTDVNGNGILDPQDLILTFSDEIDDDGNGWIDDISGWDMFDDDNDPADDTDFGHGTGEARDSAAETHNGLADAGVCPECSVLMVRVGDSFVVEANDFAMGTIFAVDSGAAVVQEALGAINSTPLMFEAIDYAWRQNVVVIASAADEDSFHANYPGSTNHTIYVHAVRYNRTSRESSDTFMAFNNCTNYGAQLLVSTPGTGCSSEATGKLSGMAGLLYAAALAADLPPPEGEAADTDDFDARRLGSEEVKQLILTTADDIYDPADATDSERYVTYEGWEKRFGYGRTNARAAVDAILAGRIPPAVDVHAPEWFQVVHPERTPALAVTGEIKYRKALFDSYDYVVEWAPGIEPLPGEWTTLAEGESETEYLLGTLATLDLADLTIDNPPMSEPDLEVNRFLVTVRVRVTLSSTDPGRDGTRGEIRRAFHIVRDPDLWPGFPVALGGGGESSPKLSDLDGDGAMELIVGDGSGTLHVFSADGQERAGWPQGLGVLPHLDPDRAGNHRATAAVASGAVGADARSTLTAQTPAIGDLDGAGPDGKSIVLGDFDGHVFVFAADGGLRPGWPQAIDYERADVTDRDNNVDAGVASSPVLADLDGDGDLEIILPALDAHVYVWHHDGTRMAPWPVLVSNRDQRQRLIETPAVGDIDGDGAPEIVLGSNEDYDGKGRFYAFEADGTIKSGWPKAVPTINLLPVVGRGLPNSPAMADLDGDGAVEVTLTSIGGLPRIFRGDGTEAGTVDNFAYGERTTSDDIPSVGALSSGSIGDLDNDGTPDILSGSAGFGFAEAFAGAGVRVDFDHHVGAWNGRTLTYFPGFPQRIDDTQFFQNPIVADVDDDGRPEVIVGSGGYYLRAWNVDGVQPAGWPKMTGGWIIASAAVGDLDGDGLLEIAVSTRGGQLFVWRTQGRRDGRIDWASFHHDDANTRNLATPIGFGVAATGADAGGCGCRVTNRVGAHASMRGGLVLAMLSLLAWLAPSGAPRLRARAAGHRRGGKRPG